MRVAWIFSQSAALMPSFAALLPVRMEDEEVLVDGVHIGSLRGFRFEVDPAARLGDRKLLLAAAERHVPGLATARAEALTAAIGRDEAGLRLEGGQILWEDAPLARLERGRTLLAPRIVADAVLHMANLPLDVNVPFMTIMARDMPYIGRG